MDDDPKSELLEHAKSLLVLLIRLGLDSCFIVVAGAILVATNFGLAWLTPKADELGKALLLFLQVLFDGGIAIYVLLYVRDDVGKAITEAGEKARHRRRTAHQEHGRLAPQVREEQDNGTDESSVHASDKPS